MKKAIGFIEVQGYSVALAIIDKICKSVDVKIMGIDCNNPSMGDKAFIPLLVQIKFMGSIDNVEEALVIGKKEGTKYIDADDVMTHLITVGSAGIEELLVLGKVESKGKRT